MSEKEKANEVERGGGINTRRGIKGVNMYSTIKIYNLSQFTFSETEFNLLRKGLNSAPENPPNRFKLFIDLTRFIRNLAVQVYYMIKHNNSIEEGESVPSPTISHRSMETEIMQTHYRPKSTFYPH